MKKKFEGSIPKILFLVLSGFLFLVWLNSLLGLDGNFQGMVDEFRLDRQEALASTNDFQEAYDETLHNDTMIVVDTSAAPGESFWLTLSITNTRSIAGWRTMLVYDTAIIYPEVVFYERPCDTNPAYPCTVWEAVSDSTARTQWPLSWMIFNANPFNTHIDTLRATSLIFFDPYGGEGSPPLPAGTGPVMRFKFWVREYAEEGRSTPIEFGFWDFVEQNPANYFSDSTGEGEIMLPRTRGGIFTVKEGGVPGNNCPVFIAPTQSSFQVNEGTTLEFDVTATDEDGDSIYLFMDPLDIGGLNYNFDPTEGEGLVTQRFDYTPDFDEAPATKLVAFKARDEHGCLTTKSVTIQVIETAQDLLMASSLQGGVVGSKDRMCPFMITNSVDIYGFQFTFRWDDTRLAVDSIACMEVLEGFSMYTNLGDSAGKATVLVFGLSGQTIPPGLDTVVCPAFRVHQDAEPGEVDILIENAKEAINPGYPSFPLGVVNGKFIIDLFGDPNLDSEVDVGDVVALVHYILGLISFNTRQELTADVNQDTLINVGDLVAMIDIILDRWIGPSPPMYPGPMAKVVLDYEDLQPGSSGEVKVMADLEVPVAGAQLQIDYDPDQVSFQVPVLSERSDHFLMEYRDDGNGKLTVLLYNMANEPIPEGEGNIMSLPVTLSSSAEEEVKIKLKEVVLADQKAALIPVGDEAPSIPVAFELSQNYPNPFNPSTTIKFTLPSRQDGGGELATTLKIYNVLGEVVKTLADEPMAPGTHHIIWDGKDDQGTQVASGIYFYRLRAGDFQDTKKMVLMK
jgi:hypothetical protein